MSARVMVVLRGGIVVSCSSHGGFAEPDLAVGAGDGGAPLELEADAAGAVSGSGAISLKRPGQLFSERGDDTQRTLITS